MQIDNVNEMNEHLLLCHPDEGCGVITDNKFVPITNVADDKENDFRMSKQTYLSHKVEGVVHSHTINGKKNHCFDQRTPSMADMIGQKSTDVPWGIAYTEGENVSPLIWLQPETPEPVLGRSYIPSVFDCLTLVTDFMKLNFDIECGTFPRPMDWNDYNKRMIEENVENAGFFALDKSTKFNELKRGDGILFKIQGNTINHCGVYEGDGQFAHHLQGRLSRLDDLGKWQKHITAFVRHKDLL